MQLAKEKLNSVGEEFFIIYNGYIQKGYTTDDLKSKVKKSYPEMTEGSITRRISTTRVIVKNKKLFREALNVCVNAKSLSKSLKDLAKTQLQLLDAPEKRIARITWNTNGWVYPSGPHGKSKNEDSYESKYGYGHEEWLFDTGKIIDGWHYAFLEPVRKEFNSYSGKKYDVWLFTINASTTVRYWLGWITNVEVITSEQAEKIKQVYREHGWLEEMENQIIASGANREGFSNYNGLEIFNIRFKPNSLKFNDPYFDLPNGHPVCKQNRYSFLKYNEEYEIKENKKKSFTFLSSSKETNTSATVLTKSIHERDAKTVEVPLLHKAISESLVAYLRAIHGIENVTPEHRTGNGASRIDIAVKDKDDKCIFYEIKTYNSLLTSMREAIGQLLEYAFYSSAQNAKELIIVTQKHENVSKVKVYLNHLRQLLNIPLYYQWYDWEKEELSEKF